MQSSEATYATWYFGILIVHYPEDGTGMIERLNMSMTLESAQRWMARYEPSAQFLIIK